jgi:hypothetical protein
LQISSQIRKKLFFFNRLSFLGRVFGILGYALLAIIVYSAIGFGMESATAKQLEAKQQAQQQVAAKSAADTKVKAEEAKVNDHCKSSASISEL